MGSRVSDLLQSFTEVLALVEQRELDPVIVAQVIDQVKTNSPANDVLSHVKSEPRHWLEFVDAVYFGLYDRNSCGHTTGIREQSVSFLETSTLSFLEVMIIRLCFGMDDPLGRPATYRDVGCHIGIKHIDVKRMLKVALRKIRKAHGIAEPP